MIDIKTPMECCGCSACASICNHDAISMQPDALGFLYPKVDMDKCINCGLCEKVCAFNQYYDTSQNLPEPIVYGARHKDIQSVMLSRSGAVFIALSDFVLDQGGVVYGVGFEGHFHVVHKLATNKIERDEFRGSKYVQSDMRNTFPLVKKDLIDGRLVMFVGTPCQTSGLNSYIGTRLRNNLLLIDIVCHGTPSPYLWRDYIDYLENKSGNKIVKVNFRDKMKFGWVAHHETYMYDNCSESVVAETNFYRSIFFRKSCNVCHFCNLRRPSDITLGDFWGWEKQDVEINNDDKGLNLVLINTSRGGWLFEQAKANLIVFLAHGNTYLQPNLCHPTAMHPFRDMLEQDYTSKGFEYVFFHDYDHATIMERVRRKFLEIKKEW